MSQTSQAVFVFCHTFCFFQYCSLMSLSIFEFILSLTLSSCKLSIVQKYIHFGVNLSVFMHHLSFVMCHVSNVTCHLLLITCCLSPVRCHKRQQPQQWTLHLYIGNLIVINHFDF